MTEPVNHDKFTKDVFISYSSVDSEEVLDFVNMLKNSGIEFWLDKIDIDWGDNFINKIFAGIEVSRYVIVFISPNSLKSTWVKKEIITAFQREVESESIVVLPVLSCTHDEFVKTFPFLASKKYIKFNDKEYIIKTLIELLRGKADHSFTFNHPRTYHGPIWIRLLAKKENDNLKHKINIRWGAWYREINIKLSHKNPLFLIHSKGNDNDSIPMLVKVNKGTYVTVGQGRPNSLNWIDINPFWVDAKSRFKKFLARVFLWPLIP